MAPWPIVQIAPFLDASVGVAAREASHQLLRELQHRGFCYISHPALPPALLANTKCHARRVFSPSALSQLRSHCATDAGFRGYYRYVGASGVRDSIECFSVGREPRASAATPSKERSDNGEIVHSDVMTSEPAVWRAPYFAARGWAADAFASSVRRCNAWPEAPSVFDTNDEAVAFRQCLLDYYAACDTTSRDVMRHIALALQLPDLETFVRAHENADHNLEVKFYPPTIGHDLGDRDEGLSAPTSPSRRPKILRRATAEMCTSDVPASPHANTLLASSPSPSPLTRASVEANTASGTRLRLDAHKDLSTVTLLAQDALGGLEVWDGASGSYVAAPVVPDALLLNAGTFLERWTRGAVPATLHRVRFDQTAAAGRASPLTPLTSSASFSSTSAHDAAAATASGRCSIVFFCFPDYMARIAPIEGLSGCDEALPPDGPFLAGDMMPMP